MIQKELRRLENATCLPAVWIGGGVNAVVGWLIRLNVGSPYELIYIRDLRALIPPVWLTVLLWTLAFFEVGALFCAVLFRRGGRDADRYGAGMLFLLLFFTEYLWYPLFFGAGRVFWSYLLTLVILAICLLLVLQTWKNSKIISILLALHGLFCLYWSVIHLIILFRG